jgi:hypothetical protein
LYDADLRQANLDDANLRGANLEYANLENANLKGAELNRSKLNGVVLGGANLRRALLYRANLEYANQEKAYLGRAKLLEASLMNADLNEAYLGGASLVGADLDSANLEKANLIGADLRKANLMRSSLVGANLNYSKIGITIFSDLDLSFVKGLETVIHSFPSYIDIHTLYLSQGNIPEIFLRGCGVPDNLIEYLPSLTGKGIQYYSCFISYSHQDDELAHRIHNDLQAAGVRCWFAPHDLKIGDRFRSAIDESIRVHDKLLLILSEHSVQSDWVEHEVEHALDRERVEKKNILFPVRMDEAVMDSATGWAGNVRRQRHIGDFTQWKEHDAYKAAFERLMRDLKAGG